MFTDIRTDESGRIVLFDDIDGEKQMFAPANRVPAENTPAVEHMLGAAGEEFIVSDATPDILDAYIPAVDPENPYDGIDFNFDLILAKAGTTDPAATLQADIPAGVDDALATPSQIDLDRMFDAMEIRHEQGTDQAFHHMTAGFNQGSSLVDAPDPALFANGFDPAHAIDELFHYISAMPQS